MQELKENFRRVAGEGSWTLFLDRDGVINRHIEGGYVLSTGQMEILPGVREAVGILSGIFKRIIIVTNQQCVGLGLLSSDELDRIHKYMLDLIDPVACISDIFVSPHVKGENSRYRKPATGMADLAASKYNDIKPERSVMAGDSRSDMLFGREAAAINVLIRGNHLVDETLYDFAFGSLLEFAEYAREV